MCPICFNSAEKLDRSIYYRCSYCNHEFITSLKNPSIVNEKLDPTLLKRWSLLENYKAQIVRRINPQRSLLIDVGSASGRFPYLMRSEFESVAGIEVNPECRRFAVEVMSIPTYEAYENSPNGASIITFWHSLEHFPGDDLYKVLRFFRDTCKKDAFLVIAVPNNMSLQAKWLGSAYTYQDLNSHYHQFSIKALDILLSRSHFKRVHTFRSPIYSVFGWLQGLLNLFNTQHNYAYYRLKRGQNIFTLVLYTGILDFYNALLMLVLAPIAIILTFLDIAFPERSAVIVLSYQPTNS